MGFSNAKILSDVLSIVGMRDSGFTKLSFIEYMLVLFAMYYFDVGSDYYVWYTVSLLAAGGFAKCVVSKTTHVGTVFCLSLFLTWFCLKGGGLVSSLLWSTGIATSLIHFCEARLGENWYEDGNEEVRSLYLIATVALTTLWGLEDWLLCRIATGVLQAYVIATTLPKRGPMCAPCTTGLFLYSYMGIGFIWSLFAMIIAMFVGESSSLLQGPRLLAFVGVPLLYILFSLFA
eukprot:m.40133 g.40133  ORF g.40133 m.40133 type:complete len:232 (-) comp9630_c0_seq2:1126-1821(-)